MQGTAKETLDDLKEIPREIRQRVKTGTQAFLDRVQAPFDDGEKAPPLHVVPRDDQWAVLPEGRKEATLVFRTKADAFTAGQKDAQRKNTVLIVHRNDGTVQEIRNHRSQ